MGNFQISVTPDSPGGQLLSFVFSLVCGLIVLLPFVLIIYFVAKRVVKNFKINYRDPSQPQACAYCGSLLPADASNCPNCGAATGKVASNMGVYFSGPETGEPGVQKFTVVREDGKASYSDGGKALGGGDGSAVELK